MDVAKEIQEEIHEEIHEKIVAVAIKFLLGLGVFGNSLALVAFSQQTSPHFIIFRVLTGAELRL